MATKPVSDRRRFARAHTAKPVEIIRRRFSGKPIAATLLDISRTGALIVTTVSIPLGEWITIRPALKGAGFGIEVDAVVHRNAPCESGHVELGCWFPEALDYSVVRPFY